MRIYDVASTTIPSIIAPTAFKSWASGTANTGPNTVTLTATNGTTTSNEQVITVSGLAFKPSTIYVFLSSTSGIGIYSSQNLNSGRPFMYTSNGHYWWLDVSPCQITSTGFVVPAEVGINQNVSWIAYE